MTQQQIELVVLDIAGTSVDATDLRHGLGLDRDVGAPEAGPVDHGATTEDYPVLHCSPQK